MTRPVIVDLFCGEGGASMGYYRAGWQPVGVDIVTQDRYPFAFVRADAHSPPFDLSRVAAVHASPPCQLHTTASNKHRQRARLFDLDRDHLTPTLAMLAGLDVPWVVENVPGARSLMPADSVVLHGGMFGLRVYRRRLFASNVPLLPPPPAAPPVDSVAVYGKRPDGRWTWKRVDGTEQRAVRSLEEGRAALDMPWASWRGLCEAVPPAYTEWLGRQLRGVRFEAGGVAWFQPQLFDAP